MPAICGCSCYGCMEDKHCKRRESYVLNCDLIWEILEELVDESR